MTEAHPRRAFIVSSHPLFSAGLSRLLDERQSGDQRLELVGVARSSDEALKLLDQLLPDVVIVDYDDQAVNRDDVLARFMAGERPMRVALVSLQAAGPLVVYDRRTLAISQAEDWLRAITANPALDAGQA